jgi:serine/threonine-protein kinase
VSDGLVAGRFRVLGLLGSGGTAAVFRAADSREKREVALKLLHPHLAAVPALWDPFFEEVRAAQSIDDPALAQIYDAGVQEGDPPVVWIAMELVAGVTLADHVRAHGPMAVATTAVLADVLLRALTAAHAGGVVHRDVTPANIMFDDTLLGDPEALGRSIRLLDFGLADVPGRTILGADPLLSGAGAPAGVVATVPYASPEQLTGAPVREASDLYQAAATLFFAVTGTPPFPGSTPAAVRAHVSAPPPVPSVRRQGVPRQWDRVLTTAMLKDPRDRYRDAATMRAALAAAATVAAADPKTGGHARTGTTRVYRTSLHASPPPPGAPGRGTRPAPRWQAWATVGLGAATIAGIVAWSAASAVPAPVPTDASTAPLPMRSATATPTPQSTAPSAMAIVPDVVGLSLPEARALLTERGLMAGQISTQDASLPAEVVLASEPSAGTRREPGTPVALRIASGSNAVAGVVGLAVAEATATLSAAGFGVALRESGDGPEGVVTTVEPAVGLSIPLGTTVVITTPRRPSVVPTGTPTPVPTLAPSPSGTTAP